ncbi:RNA deprotection pyrophosphohydrolase [Metabacillus arenae]|uniref:Nucleoside triphosphatase YtkD n=1 Tax=Metabacillus arenae TaxID=2771434 RepID=A0A926NFC6_9BACI|nr:nucleoside triphosphatase YtkD [Metabacillus arenae]MBD1380231.1 nucleoside triphosphatase YtkD [Metabacillus arenae]
METFKDYYHNEVTLSFMDHPFSADPKHVWVICRFQDMWLLTEHGDRGYEFPGGKVEKGEDSKTAACREVKEETGGIVQRLVYIGQYKVIGKEKIIIKNIFFAKVNQIIKQPSYYETKGPVLLDKLPNDIKQNPKFSFIMKDDVLNRSMQKLYEYHLV